MFELRGTCLENLGRVCFERHRLGALRRAGRRHGFGSILVDDVGLLYRLGRHLHRLRLRRWLGRGGRRGFVFDQNLLHRLRRGAQILRRDFFDEDFGRRLDHDGRGARLRGRHIDVAQRELQHDGRLPAGLADPHKVAGTQERIGSHKVIVYTHRAVDAVDHGSRDVDHDPRVVGLDSWRIDPDRAVGGGSDKNIAAAELQTLPSERAAQGLECRGLRHRRTIPQTEPPVARPFCSRTQAQ